MLCYVTTKSRWLDEIHMPLYFVATLHFGEDVKIYRICFLNHSLWQRFISWPTRYLYLYDVLQFQPQQIVQITSNIHAAELQKKTRYCFRSSPECSREFRVIFLHYQMHYEKVYLITFPSQILSLWNVQCFRRELLFEN